MNCPEFDQDRQRVADQYSAQRRAPRLLAKCSQTGRQDRSPRPMLAGTVPILSKRPHNRHYVKGSKVSPQSPASRRGRAARRRRFDWSDANHGRPGPGANTPTLRCARAPNRLPLARRLQRPRSACRRCPLGGTCGARAQAQAAQDRADAAEPCRCSAAISRRPGAVQGPRGGGIRRGT